MTLTAEQLSVVNLHHFCHRFLLSVHRLHPGKHVLDESQQLDFIREVTDVLREELREGRTADLRKKHGVSVYFGDVEQSIFSFLGASASTFASAVADCKRHYFRTNFRATPLLLEILMHFSLEAPRCGDLP